MAGVPFTEQEDRDLREMWDDATPLSLIASALGRSVKSVRHRADRLALGRYKLDTGPRHRMTDAVHAKILEMRAEGRTLKEIGQAIGFSFSSVADVINGRRRRVKNYRVVRAQPHADCVNQRPPDYVIAERDRRYTVAPRDNTAALLGDPLPGYSALDRR